MLPILPAKRGFGVINDALPGAAKSIQGLVSDYRTGKLANKLAADEGMPENAQLYKMAIKQDPNRFMELRSKGREGLSDRFKDNSDPTSLVFNEMVDLLEQDAPGIGYSLGARTGLEPEAVQNRAKFNGMRAQFEKALLPSLNKGPLSDARFKYIMSLIPKGDERQREIAGKLDALAAELGLDRSRLANIFERQKEHSKKQRSSAMANNPHGRDSEWTKPSSGRRPPLESFAQ